MIVGMLVCKQTRHVLKPATKAILGEREIAFYENLKDTQDPTIAQLKQFVPHYYGTTELRVFNKRKNFFARLYIYIYILLKKYMYIF